MKSITIRFRAYIPTIVRDKSGKNININRWGESCLPLVSMIPASFAAYATDTETSARLYTTVKISFKNHQDEELDIQHGCGETTQYPGFFLIDRKKRM